jgi:hypothetical protein
MMGIFFRLSRFLCYLFFERSAPLTLLREGTVGQFALLRYCSARYGGNLLESMLNWLGLRHIEVSIPLLYLFSYTPYCTQCTHQPVA